VSTQDLLAERYGAPSPWRRPALRTAIAALAVVALGWLAWTIWVQSSPAVASGELTFDIIDDGTASAGFVVDVEDGVVATCTLRAYAEDHTLVGTVSFVPEPSPAGRVTQEISTDRRATSVELLGCTAPGQSRPR
jgi:hypothetical protein